MNNRAHAIKDRWNALADDWNRFRTKPVVDNIIADPMSYFRTELQALFQRFVGDFAGREVLVIGSGSGRAAFAFHLLGARVTALDLSEKQIEHTASVARAYDWDISFINDDAVTLRRIDLDRYDFVYMPNGVLFWIDDLSALYASVRRVLKPGGLYLTYDMHPFMPPFDFGNTSKAVLIRDYDNVGPMGDMATYHWRMQDIVNAMVASGLRLVHMEEMKAASGTFWVDEDKAGEIPPAELAQLYKRETNPLYALPQCLSLVARK